MVRHWVYGLSNIDLQAINSAATIADVAAVTCAYLTTMGFRHGAYHLVRMTGYGDHLPTFFTSYPDEWTSRYWARGYARIDPILRAARGRSLAFRWHDLMPLSDAEHRFLAEAASLGITDGLTIPIHFAQGFAKFCVIPDGSPRERAEVLELASQAVTTLAFHVHERAWPLFEQRVLIERSIDPSLSARELECIKWLSGGHSAAEIGDILTISSATVTHHLRRAARRLNVINRTQLCVRAVAMGLVDPG